MAKTQATPNSSILTDLRRIAKLEGVSVGSLKRRILREFSAHYGYRIPVDQRQKCFSDWSGLYCLQLLENIGVFSPTKVTA